MKIRDFARRWAPVALGAAVGVAVALTWFALTPKPYKATTTLFVGSPGSTDSSIAYNLDLFSQQRALTYSQLAQSRDLAVKVRDDLGLSISPEELSAKVSIAPVPKTVLMTISATDSSPQYASDIANMFASDFTQYVARLETPKGSDQPSAIVTVVQKAEPPELPTSPSIIVALLTGLVLGAAIGLLVQWVMRIVDRRVRTSEQVAQATGVPVLGVVPRDAARLKQRLNLATDATSAYAEALRKLRANLLYAAGDAPPRAITFVSSTSTVATTAIATNLAVVLDGMGRHVALVDADMRESRMASYIGSGFVDALVSSGRRRRAEPDGAPRLRQVRGLSSVLTGQSTLVDEILRVPDTRIDLLLAGPPSKNAGELLASDALAKLFTDLRNTYDFVMCDTPGFLTVIDAADVGRASDCVVLVAAQGKTRVDGLSEAANTLRSVGVRIIGAVLTEAR